MTEYATREAVAALRELMEERWAANRREVEAALEGRAALASESTRHAELLRLNMEKRLDGMNDLRAQINAERATYVTREVYDQFHTLLAERVFTIEKAVSVVPTRTEIVSRGDQVDRRLGDLDIWRSRVIGMSVGVSAVVGLITGTIAAVVGHVWGK